MKAILSSCGAVLLAAALLPGNAALAQNASTPAQKSGATAEEVQQLREALAAQQKQLAEQQARIDALIKLVGTQPQLHAPSLGEVASTAPMLPAAGKLDASIPQPAPQTSGSNPDQPSAIHYKGITITPGGFLELNTVVRNRNENASVNSATGDANIPFPGSPNGTLSEFRFDARHSRVSLKGEGKIGSTKVTGYYEVDFLGAAPTANENQSNSFNLRQRQLWGMVNFANGFSVTGGQQWSLFTLTRKAMENGSEFQPVVVNPQYMIGFDWSRQPGLRVIKNFSNKVWAGFAVENASMVLSAQSFGAAAPALVTTAAPANNITLAGIPLYGFNGSANAVSPNGNFTLANTPGANGVSTNLAPDLVAKLTFEPGWGHFEVKGIARFFRDRYAGQNNSTVGGAFGLAGILPLVKSKLDLIAEGSLGNGFGRYGSGGGFDVTLKPDGTIKPIRTYHGLVGPEIHIGKNLDIYGYFGAEYYQRTMYLTSATSGIGYGLPFATNTSCQSQQTTATAVPGACNGNTRVAWELSPGFTYRFYKGTAGAVQMGVQYSYSERTLWSGTGGLPAGSAGLAPTGNVSQVLTSFRYVLP